MRRIIWPDVLTKKYQIVFVRNFLNSFKNYKIPTLLRFCSYMLLFGNGVTDICQIQCESVILNHITSYKAAFTIIVFLNFANFAT